MYSKSSFLGCAVHAVGVHVYNIGFIGWFIKLKIKKWAIKYPFGQIYNLSLNSIELAVFIDKLSQRLGINCCKLEWCNNYYLYIHTWTIRYTIYYAYTIKIENLSRFNQYLIHVIRTSINMEVILGDLDFGLRTFLQFSAHVPIVCGLSTKI